MSRSTRSFNLVISSASACNNPATKGSVLVTRSMSLSKTNLCLTTLCYDTPTGPYTNVLDLYLFPSMSHRHSAHLQRQSNKEVPIDRIWNAVESVWSDTVSAEVARLCQ